MNKNTVNNTDKYANYKSCKILYGISARRSCTCTDHTFTDLAAILELQLCVLHFRA